MFRLSFVTKSKINVFFHPFKYGFWCILGWTNYKSVGRYDRFGIMWEEWDSYAGDGDYGYGYYWTGNRKTTKDLWKNYRHCIFQTNDEGGFEFVLPFFLAWLVVLPGTIRCMLEEKKAMKYFTSKEYEEKMMEFE